MPVFFSIAHSSNGSMIFRAKACCQVKYCHRKNGLHIGDISIEVRLTTVSPTDHINTLDTQGYITRSTPQPYTVVQNAKDENPA